MERGVTERGERYGEEGKRGIGEEGDIERGTERECIGRIKVTEADAGFFKGGSNLKENTYYIQKLLTPSSDGHGVKLFDGQRLKNRRIFNC